MMPLGSGEESSGPVFASTGRCINVLPRQLRPPGGATSSGTLSAAPSASSAEMGQGFSTIDSTVMFCDQCGDPCVKNSRLAVCEAPGCGVSLAQCATCGVEYSRCCSAACQSSVAERGGEIGDDTLDSGRAVAQPGGPSSFEPPQQALGSFGTTKGDAREQEHVPLVRSGDIALGSRGSTVQGMKNSAPNGGGRVAHTSKGGKRRRGDAGSLSGVAQAGGAELPGSDVGSDVVSNGQGVSEVAAGERSGRRREKAEPVVESYASRHSAPESSCLAGVREATYRCVQEGDFFLCLYDFCAVDSVLNNSLVFVCDVMAY